MLKLMVGRLGVEPRTSGLKGSSRMLVSQGDTSANIQEIAVEQPSNGAGLASNFREPLPPETIALIWIGMGFAAFIALALVGLHWAGKLAERAAEPKPIDTSPREPDQEWAHYPQDEAKLRDKGRH